MKMNLERWAKGRGYEYFGNASNPDIIIFGEYHNRIDLVRAQVEAIDLILPEYHLHEFIPSHRSIRRDDHKFYYPLTDLKYIKFIMCDLPREELENVHQEFYRLGLPPAARHIYREKQAMAPIITRFTRISRRLPNVATFGIYHAHPESAIYPMLQNAGVSYFAVMQVPERRLKLETAKRNIVSILEDNNDERSKELVKFFSDV